MQNSGTKTERGLKKIVFFGSGPVAAASLDLLVRSFAVEAVVTKPRPSHHRGPVPVLEVAQKHNLKVIEVSSKKEVSAKITSEHFKSKVAVLIDFGIIVSQDVIDAFPLGIVNSHFSLLPEWRGADPITFAILSGQTRTGVCLMLLVEAMDEGPIIGLGVQDLDETFNTPILTDKLVQLSYALLRDQLPQYIEIGQKNGIAQSDLPNVITDFAYPSKPTYSRKLSKEDSLLDFTKPAKQLEREVRAFLDWPKSRTVIADKEVIITSAHTDDSAFATSVADVFVHEKQLCIQASEGVLVIDRLKPAGKPEMTAEAFLAGYGTGIKK